MYAASEPALCARSIAATSTPTAPNAIPTLAMSRSLRQADERDAPGEQRDACDPQRRDRMLVEADPAEVVDEERGDRLACEDQRDESCGAELRRGHDRAEHVERAEHT